MSAGESTESIILLPKDRLLEKLAIDVYLGDGKDNPPLVTRVALLEDGMETVRENITEIKDTHKQNQKLIIGTLVSSLGGLFLIVIELLKH